MGFKKLFINTDEPQEEVKSEVKSEVKKESSELGYGKTRNYNEVVQFLDSCKYQDYDEKVLQRMKELDKHFDNVSQKFGELNPEKIAAVPLLPQEAKGIPKG